MSEPTLEVESQTNPLICHYGQDSGPAIERAKADGMEIVESSPRTLLLDLDSPLALHVFEEAFRRLQNACGLTERERWVSKSGKGTHVVIESACDLSLIDRVALQSMLGSDPMREALHWAAIRAGSEPTIVLFRPARTAAEVAA